MARNQIQFQKGISFAGLQRLYGTEEQCHEAIVRMRWSDSFVWPRCHLARAEFTTKPTPYREIIAI